MKLARFVFHYLVRYWRWALLAVAATLAYALATVFLLQLIQAIFGEVLRADGPGLGDQLPAVVSQMRDQVGGADEDSRVFLDRYLNQSYVGMKRAFGVTPANTVYFVPILFVVVFLLRSAGDFVNGYSFQRIGFGSTTDLRDDLYERTLAQSSRFHSEHPSGELVSRVVHDVGVLQTAISGRFVDLIQQSVTLLGLLALLFSIHFRLALFCLVAAPALLYPIIKFAKGMRKISHRAQERTADLANLVAEVSRGHRVVKAFGMEEFELKKFRVATRRHLSANLRGQLLANLASPVVESMGVFGAGAFLIFAGRTIQSGSMDSATLIKFLFNLYMMYDPIRRLNKANLVVQQSVAAAQRLRQVMELPIETVDRPNAVREVEEPEEIRFEEVVFRYDHREILKSVSLSVRRGEVVAFVGPSGGGKTTLVNLLPRFFDVDSGRVTLDGRDVRDIELASLRKLIGLVTQDTVLFNDSVRNNIAYGRSDLPLEEVRRAAQKAYADDFLIQLPDGYDTNAGEGGVRFSGGERQRIAIARAILKNAPILILDEATSQLDAEAEALVQKALSNLMRDRTTLVIAHRLSTVIRADKICVIEAGRIVEQGRHDELLAGGGLYRRLYELQFQDAT